MQNNRKDQIRMTVGQLSETNYTDVELDCIMILNTTKKPKRSMDLTHHLSVRGVVLTSVLNHKAPPPSPV